MKDLELKRTLSKKTEYEKAKVVATNKDKEIEKVNDDIRRVLSDISVLTNDSQNEDSLKKKIAKS